MSTNKVYGDRPNTIPLNELETRWDYADPAYDNGIPEDFSIDQIQALDVRRVQSGCRRHGAGVRALLQHAYLLPAGRLPTGPNHSGVELHGFLSYLIKCNMEGREYKVTVTRASRCATTSIPRTWRAFMFEFWKAPPRCRGIQPGRRQGERLLHSGGVSECRGDHRPAHASGEYVDENRIGDHICYYSDLRKMKAHYPAWDITKLVERHL